MGWLATCLFRQPPAVLDSEIAGVEQEPVKPDTVFITAQPEAPAAPADVAPTTSPKEMPAQPVKSTDFRDVEPRTMLSNHPFRLEAAKLLSGRLEETDSVNRHKILSYCEHLRTSYTTRDIDFIRQVFSDNALIIVGHVVKTGSKPGAAISNNSKVVYNIRSKREYLENLSKIFDSGKPIDVKFSEFKIMRHPTVSGLYGVTLRQGYSCGNYSDDGYLFLLWDFRNMSMPLIHVRTWQPSMSVDPDEDDIIGIGDFNLE